MNPARSHPDHDAPEVVPRAEDHGPIHVPNDAQAPEAVYQGGSPYQPVPGQDHDDDLRDEKGAHTAVKPADDISTKKTRSRKWLWIGLVALLVVLAVGLGAGLGIGLSKNSKSNSGSSSVADQASP
jgi:hypothetical protein